jgi:hypothetical protein
MMLIGSCSCRDYLAGVDSRGDVGITVEAYVICSVFTPSIHFAVPLFPFVLMFIIGMRNRSKTKLVPCDTNFIILRSTLWFVQFNVRKMREPNRNTITSKLACFHDAGKVSWQSQVDNWLRR